MNTEYLSIYLCRLQFLSFSHKMYSCPVSTDSEPDPGFIESSREPMDMGGHLTIPFYVQDLNVFARDSENFDIFEVLGTNTL